MNPEEKWMEIAIEEAKKAPWPFGAAIVIDGQLVSQAGSGDGADNDIDPTAHAEVNAIRFACKALNTHGLPTHAVIYASCEPCAMCMGAIWYSGIRNIVYGSSIEEMQSYFPWKDLAFPNDTLQKLTNGELQVQKGFLKEKVMGVYKNHSARI